MAEKSPQNWKEVGKTKTFDLYYTVDNLDEGKSYYFAVAAENEVGMGKMIETESPVTPKKPLGKNHVKLYKSASAGRNIRFL